MHNTMKLLLSLTFVLTLTVSAVAAEDLGKLIFQDNFDRNEADEATEAVGNGWSTNSKSRAAGNKQVDLRDGTLHIYIHPKADHAVSVRHAAEFENGTVRLRFKLENPQDVLGLNFADPQLKSVHAGHLFKVSVNTKAVDIEDLKTGKMDLERWQARKAKQPVSEQTRKLLATKKKRIPHPIKTDQWYMLQVSINGDNVVVKVNDKPVGTFQSDGFGHATKRLLRLSVPREAVVDDLQIYSRDV